MAIEITCACATVLLVKQGIAGQFKCSGCGRILKVSGVAGEYPVRRVGAEEWLPLAKLGTLGLTVAMVLLIVAFNVGGQEAFGFNIGLLTVPVTLLLLGSLVTLLLLAINLPLRPYVPHPPRPRKPAKTSPTPEKPKTPVLSREDKQVAKMGGEQQLQTLRDFCHACATNDQKAVDRLEKLVQAIGRRQDREGGINQMRAFYSLLGQIPSLRTLDRFWDGIGQWRG